MVQRYDAGNQAYSFMLFSGFATESALLSHVDTGLMYDAAGQNTFVTAGSYCYMDGPGYFHYISGAKYVYGFAANSYDVAYHYDGSGASALVVSGTAYSFMLGTDHGTSFFNEAVGFTTNYGIATHAGQDSAYFYDSAGNDVFVGNTMTSYLYIGNPDGKTYAEFDYAQGFALVEAYSFVGGDDVAYVYDPTINAVEQGFRRLV